MMHIEIRAGEGGADAEAFTDELTTAILRYANGTAELDGGAIIVPDSL